MATLVLTTVGGLLGPVGAAVGGLIGSAIDHGVIFKPPAREGPRLKELAVQTSSYGTQIPKLFGTMRVAGSVIWATELQEHRSTTSGGKGRPGTVSYSYTASFAVALSARPILAVRRIWADGKLLRGAAGDFKTRTGFRLHLGGEDQAVDPLIAAAEGVEATAHRGIAYAVFEDLELGDFGNRIPSLSFEVEADAAPVSVGAMLAEVTEGRVTGEGAAVLAGFSAHGASRRAVAETLGEVAGGWFRSDGARLVLTVGAGEAVTIADRGVRAGNAGAPRATRAIAADDTAPRRASVSHYDPARDYQAGLQQALRPGAGTREARIELPAVLDAGAAKTIAEAMLARLDLGRERRTLALEASAAMGLTPGDRLRIAGEPGLWRIDGWSLEAMVAVLDCVRVAPAALPAAAAPGRVLGAPDLRIGETVLIAAELPPLGDSVLAAPRIAVMAAGEPGWRSAAFQLSRDGGGRWDAAGMSAAPARIGRIVTPPGPGSPLIEDRANSITIELGHGGMTLEAADSAALDAGANLALVGDELVQFGEAVSIGAGRWRLGRLWRGRRGTEAAIGTQAEGDRFALIEAAAMVWIDLPGAVPGTAARISALGAGDAEAVTADAPVDGRSVLPPAPVHLRGRPGEDGATMLSWVRRSRSGWRWSDGAETPLAEEREAYRVILTPADRPGWSVSTEAPLLLVEAGARTSALTISVRQIGIHGLSPEARLILPALGGD